MAVTSLTDTAKPANEALEADLRALVVRAGMLEDALRGAHGVLHSISQAGLLDHLPQEDYRDGHNAALASLRVLESHLNTVAAAEDDQDWWLSCEIARLADKAKRRELVRYGKPIAE